MNAVPAPDSATGQSTPILLLSSKLDILWLLLSTRIVSNTGTTTGSPSQPLVLMSGVECMVRERREGTDVERSGSAAAQSAVRCNRLSAAIESATRDRWRDFIFRYSSVSGQEEEVQVGYDDRLKVGHP